MLSSYILALREGLEMALIIGIVLGVLKQMGRKDLNKIVWYGAGVAGLISVVAAVILNLIGASFEGAAEKIFEGITMLLAAGVLTWMVFWMQKQSKNITQTIKNDVQLATMETGTKALFFLAFFAVLREGIELALFLTASAMTAGTRSALLGGVLGLGTSFLLGVALFASLLKLNLRHFFQVTGVLLIIFAAGLVAHGVHEFNEVGWIPSIIEHVWDINPILNEKSEFGLILKALFGYNGNPSLTEVFAYVAYFAAIILGLRYNATSETETQLVA